MAENWKPLPITGPPHQNLSSEQELDVRSALVMDAYVDEAGYTVKRPGLTDWVTLDTDAGIDGHYWWDEAEVMLVVSASGLYMIQDSSGLYTTVATGLDLPDGNRVSFATAPDGLSVLMASGNTIVQTDGLTAASLTDPDAPTHVRSLIVYDQTLIAQTEGSNSYIFSEPGDVTNIRAQDVASAESRPDRLMTLLGTLDGFVLFGKTTTEFHLNDGVTPFARVNGLTHDRGCGARYSPALLGDTWMWIDERRRVVRSTLNKIEIVSDSVDAELQALSTIEDGLGDMLTVNGWSLYMLSFPTANRTFVYDLKQNSWAEWGQWDSQSGAHSRFTGNGYAYSPKWNLHVMGDKVNGEVFHLSKTKYDDVYTQIRSLRRTGFITHGTGNKKRCKAIRLRLKRSTATGAYPAPVMTMRYRETGGAWSVERPLSLGAVGQHEMFVTIKQLGSYRARQYEFAHSDSTSWVLMSGEEDVEIMER